MLERYGWEREYQGTRLYRHLETREYKQRKVQEKYECAKSQLHRTESQLDDAVSELIDISISINTSKSDLDNLRHATTELLHGTAQRMKRLQHDFLLQLDQRLANSDAEDVIGAYLAQCSDERFAELYNEAINFFADNVRCEQASITQALDDLIHSATQNSYKPVSQVSRDGHTH